MTLLIEFVKIVQMSKGKYKVDINEVSNDFIQEFLYKSSLNENMFFGALILKNILDDKFDENSEEKDEC